MMRIDVVTLFPEMFSGVISQSILKIGRDKELVDIQITHLRDFSTDKHRKVDSPPYGGGPGMVIQVEPVVRAVEHLRKNGRKQSTLVLLTPSGRRFTQEVAWELSKKKGLILLCGHYEGFDERVRQMLKPEEISVGDYVLTGGEIPAMAVTDAVVRLMPGVLGSADSLKEESFSSGMLEYPQYTRPADYRGREVPGVLRSGNHQEIARWRKAQAEQRTRKRRPDLLKGASSS